MANLKPADKLILRRARRRERAPGEARAWLLVGVASDAALAAEIARQASAAWDGDEIRVFGLRSFVRELSSTERERVLEAMRNPTRADQERFAALRAAADERLRYGAPVQERA